MTTDDMPMQTRRPGPFTIVIFGASGDLTRRKLMPALYTMFVEKLLPESFCIIGFARRDWTDASFRELTADALREFSRAGDVPEQVLAFCDHVLYHKGDILEDPASFAALTERIRGQSELPDNTIFYLSVKPDLFEPIIRRLSAAGAIRHPNDKAWSRVVVEKPFGRDLASARQLNRSIQRFLAESQIYRIDHYLGKETVQNILSFRFANSIFEPVFNNQFVHHIQITAAETTGMETGRGAYYDANGALRDMVQNHLLQLLCLSTMEPPSSLTAEAIRNEKVKVLQSIRPPVCICEMAVRAQYTHGAVKGEPVNGYLKERHIDPNSRTATFTALRLFVENWRWAGVPIYLRTGKRLNKRATEIVVQFKTPPLQLFQTVQCQGDVCDLAQSKPNLLIFRIQPDEGIYLRFSAKRPVMQLQVENVDMNFSYANTWKRVIPEAYERLLLDIMRGDSTLFTRSDEVDAAWQIVDPILSAWETNRNIPLYSYQAGTWGPMEAADIFTGSGTFWYQPW